MKTASNLENKPKILVLDTSVLIENPLCLEQFADGNNTVVVPYVVIHELDVLKNGIEQRNYNARRAIEAINDLSGAGSLLAGVKIGAGGVIKIDCGNFENNYHETLNINSNDDKILLTTLKYQHESLEGTMVVLVTLDNIMMIKAHCLGLKVEDVKNMRVNIENSHKGFREINISAENMDLLKSKKIINVKGNNDFFSLNDMPAENEFIVINNNRKFITRYNKDLLKIIHPPKSVFSIGPLENNLSQYFAWDLLFDENVSIVSLVGSAGTGKTFLALTTALAQLNNFPGGYNRIYDKVLVITPTVAISKEQDLGFLPGEKYEKILPWVQAIFDNLKIIEKDGDVNPKDVENLTKEGFLEIVNINHIRGRSLSNAFIIVDESQNFTASEIKLIGTRPAKGSKIVFAGDPSQVNRNYLSRDNNGLVRVVNAFKNSSDAGVVFFNQVVRSRIAELFAEKF